MESLSTDHFSATSSIHFRPSPQPLFSEELRPKKRIRANLACALEENLRSVVDMPSHRKNTVGAKFEEKQSASTRVTIRKSITLKIPSLGSTIRTQSPVSHKSYTKRKFSFKSANPMHPRFLPQKHNVQEHSTPSVSNDKEHPRKMTEKGYDVKLVREYMKRKRKESKFNNPNDLLKDIFKPLHHVASPPRVSTPPKEVRQQLKTYMTRRKQTEKKRALEQIRLAEEQKRKRLEVLEALDKQRKENLEIQLKQAKEARAKKQQMIKERLASAAKSDEVVARNQSIGRSADSFSKKRKACRTFNAVKSWDASMQSMEIETSSTASEASSSIERFSSGHEYSNPPSNWSAHHGSDSGSDSMVPPNYSTTPPVLGRQMYTAYTPGALSQDALFRDLQSIFQDNDSISIRPPACDSTLHVSLSHSSLQTPFPTSPIHGTSSLLSVEDPPAHLDFDDRESSLHHHEKPTTSRLFDTSPKMELSENVTTFSGSQIMNSDPDYYLPLRIYSRLVSVTSSNERMNMNFTSDKNTISSFDSTKMSLPSSPNPGSFHITRQNQYSPPSPNKRTTITYEFDLNRVKSDGFEKLDQLQYSSSGLPPEPSPLTTQNYSSPAQILPPCDVVSIQQSSGSIHQFESQNEAVHANRDLTQTLALSSEIIETIHSFQTTIKNDILPISINKTRGPASSESVHALNSRKSEPRKHEAKEMPEPSHLEVVDGESDSQQSSKFATSENGLTETAIRRMISAQLAPMIEDIEQKLQRLQLLISSRGIVTKEISDASPTKFSPTEQDAHVTTHYLLPVPSFETLEKELHQSMLLENPVVFASMNQHDTCYEAVSRLLSSTKDTENVSLSIEATVDTNSICETSQLTDIPLGLDTSELESKQCDPNPYNSIDKNKPFDHPFASEQENLEVNEVEQLMSQKSTLSFLQASTREVPEPGFERIPLMNAPFSTTASIAESIDVQQEENFLDSGSSWKVTSVPDIDLNHAGTNIEEIALSDYEIREESHLAPSPNVSNLLAYAEIQYSDTFISSSTSLELHDETPIVDDSHHHHDSSNNFSQSNFGPENENRMQVTEFPTETMLLHSDSTSVSISTESILNTSCLSSMASELRDEEALPSNLSQLKEHEASELLSLKEIEKISSHFFPNNNDEEVAENLSLEFEEEPFIENSAVRSTEVDAAPSLVEINAETPVADSIMEEEMDEKEEKAENEPRIISAALASVKSKSASCSAISTLEEGLHQTSLSIEPPSVKDVIGPSHIRGNTTSTDLNSMSPEESISEILSISSISESIENGKVLLSSHCVKDSLSPLNGDLSAAHYTENHSQEGLYDSSISVDSIINDILPLPENRDVEETLMSLDVSCIHPPRQTSISEGLEFTATQPPRTGTPKAKPFDSNISGENGSNPIVNKTIEKLVLNMIQDVARATLKSESRCSSQSFQIREMEYAEQYIKFLLLHHHSSISKETQFSVVDHPLFKDTEFNQLLTNTLQEFQSDWFRRTGPSSWPDSVVPACVIYRAFIASLHHKSHSIEDQLNYEIQQEQDSVYLIDFASFFEDKMEDAVNGLVEQLINETNI